MFRSQWIYVVPHGFRNLLNWVSDHYGNPPVIITENGMCDNNATLDDHHRINYYNLYINNVLKGEGEIGI
jgi:lactase-phlorizin hydrolase